MLLCCDRHVGKAVDSAVELSPFGLSCCSDLRNFIDMVKSGVFSQSAFKSVRSKREKTEGDLGTTGRELHWLGGEERACRVG